MSVTPLIIVLARIFYESSISQMIARQDVASRRSQKGEGKPVIFHGSLSDFSLRISFPILPPITTTTTYSQPRPQSTLYYFQIFSRRIVIYNYELILQKSGYFGYAEHISGLKHYSNKKVCRRDIIRSKTSVKNQALHQ